MYISMCVCGNVILREQVLEDSRKGHFDSLEVELQKCKPDSLGARDWALGLCKNNTYT